MSAARAHRHDGGSRRRQREIVALLAAFPRQYAALESAMAAFGGDFDAHAFKRAFEATEDLADYNRAQALERALGRVQNFVADLAMAGVHLARLPHAGERHASPAARAFAALRDAGVVDPGLCRQLMQAQAARSRIEHSYVEVAAGDVHRAAELVHDAAGRFVPRFRNWIEPYLPR